MRQIVVSPSLLAPLKQQQNHHYRCRYRNPHILLALLITARFQSSLSYCWVASSSNTRTRAVTTTTPSAGRRRSIIINTHKSINHREAYPNRFISSGLSSPRHFRLYSTSSSMSFPVSSKEYSLEGLQEYATSLVASNSEQDESTRGSVCIAVAGGGGHAISTLASTPGASSTFLEGSITYDRNSYLDYVGISLEDVDFKYSSQKAAALASEAALRRAMKFRSNNLKLMAGCVGVGCASALVSSSSKSSGRGHVVATRADGYQLSLSVSLEDKSDGQTRTRVEEDIFMSHLVLRVIGLLQGVGKDMVKDSNTVTDLGDSIAEVWGATSVESGKKVDDDAFAGANRVLNDETKAVVLLPVFKEGCAPSFCALKYPVIPEGSLVFPGSFNPPHIGHATLAAASVKAANKLSHRHSKKNVYMELSLTNADKDPIDAAAVSQRLHKFLHVDGWPENWGIILTRAPLFSEKVESLEDAIVGSVEKNANKLSFVIGTDTFVRIINPKYYDNDETKMIEALQSMEGIRFFVGGRLEQKKGSSEPAKFISGKEDLEKLPKELQTKFTIIEESDFRVDISSSEIRSQQS